MQRSKSRKDSALAGKFNFKLPSRALLESVEFKPERLEILYTEPSSRWFVVWFAVSCYFPVLTACLGPLSNMISVACTVDHWRVNTNTGKEMEDPTPVKVLNIISLVSGIIANFILLLNFTGKLAYVKAQIICVTAWVIAQLTLTIALLICTIIYFDDGIDRSIGYWFAVITACLYFLCLALQLAHVTGYYKDKYPATFNLLDNERLLMKFTFLLSIWFLWGAAMFSQLLDQTFGASLYFCVISVLTIGLGDILPKNVASQITILIYSLAGVIIIGLVVVMISGTVKSSSGPIFFFHSVEIQRDEAYRRQLVNPNPEFTDSEAYDMIKSMRKHSSDLQRRNSIILIVTIFVLFVVLGALVLYFAESWNYFESFYFCLLTVLTIGYGVPSPISGCGRAFYVIWCLGAVPLMTVLISTVGDFIYDLSKDIDNNIPEFLTIKYLAQILQKLFRRLPNCFVSTDSSTESTNQNKDVESLPKDQESEDKQLGPVSQREEMTNKISFMSSSTTRIRGGTSLHDKCKSMPSLSRNVGKASRFSKIAKIKELLDDLQEIDLLSHQDRAFEFSYTQWVRYLRLKSKPEYPNQHLFWISEESPLRYPLRQSLYLTYKLTGMINDTLDSLLNEIEIEELMSHDEK
ncbi:unnamed protein product [Kluyveromyces dobzhanskii CBS 2104]|uniref:WGS project CCBQ000000000 data, contig 00010 n=1 Tax=Kluyveromyces dobzhanskii CBS 2104 TaxID=1427455 RepID=A0A0A8LAE8_9SACH|nr:unnamed protein product [Kluyveromyces dobzhanskii CBS 2104]